MLRGLEICLTGKFPGTAAVLCNAGCCTPKGTARRERGQDGVPAVLFGKHLSPFPLSLPAGFCRFVQLLVRFAELPSSRLPAHSFCRLSPAPVVPTASQ